MTEAEFIDIKERLVLGDRLSSAQLDFVLDAVNTAVAVVHDVPNYLGRIENIWAYLSSDEGGEGVCAAPIAGMTLPLIAADQKRLTQIKPIARQIAIVFKKPVQLVRFTTREDVETYEP